jgi:hypothetical protein
MFGRIGGCRSWSQVVRVPVGIVGVAANVDELLRGPLPRSGRLKDICRIHHPCVGISLRTTPIRGSGCRPSAHGYRRRRSTRARHRGALVPRTARYSSRSHSVAGSYNVTCRWEFSPAWLPSRSGCLRNPPLVPSERGRIRRGMVIGPRRMQFARIQFGRDGRRHVVHHGRLAQRESASFTPRKSLVRSQYRPPQNASSA